MIKKITLLLVAALPLFACAQDDLVKKLDGNKSDSAKKKFRFTKVIDVETTSVKNQASSGTCWSYSGNSLFESEMIRMGKQPVELSQLYTARCVYMDRADIYVRLHGAAGWGDGAEFHDVVGMYAKYGAVPREAYTGLNYGTTKNKFAEMQAILKGMLDAVVKNPNGKLTPNWKKAFEAVLDVYLGKVPETFEWQGKTYTPRTFADKVVGINPTDYVELMAWSSLPLYEKSTMMVSDNWNFQKAYNVKMEDLTTIIDNALKNGYTVAWATDVSEKSYSWKNGVAYVPEKDYDDMDEDEKKNMFDGPKPERTITAKMRQEAYDNYSTTDDHGMHIVGTAKDQNDKEYYIVKNSWGEKNDYKGYIYVTKAYVQYKTMSILLNRNALPKSVTSNLHLAVK